MLRTLMNIKEFKGEFINDEKTDYVGYITIKEIKKGDKVKTLELGVCDVLFDIDENNNLLGVEILKWEEL